MDLNMEFSRKDLEDIQRVAGLLNLTVDELIQQRRRSSAGVGSQRSHGINSTPQLAHGRSQQAAPLTWGHHGQAPQCGSFMDVDSAEFDEVPSNHSAGIETHSSIGSSTLSTAPQDAGDEVILLNPQNVWYECNSAIFDFDDSAGETFTMDESSFPEGDSLPEDDGGDSYIPVQMRSDTASECTAREEEQEGDLDDGTDWALVPSPSRSQSSFQIPTSPTTGSLDKRYHLIAPKLGRGAPNSVSVASSNKVRKKRSPYQGAKKIATHLTRQVHACVRCRMQRNRVSNRVLLVLYAWHIWSRISRKATAVQGP
jgi:hypothetical protein